jgi:hypothetical protein
MKSCIAGVGILLGIWATCSFAVPATKLPPYVDTKLAGVSLLNSPFFWAYDAKTGYYLWVEHEAYAYNTLFITPDPRLFHRPKERTDYRQMSFPLITGKGIKINDEIQSVYQKLGRPHATQNHMVMGKMRQVDIYQHWNGKKGSPKRHYRAVYLSYKGRVQAIQFNYYRGEN